MPASPDAALSAIEQGKLQPVYWLYGEEIFFSDRLLTALKKAVVTSAPDFNFDRFEGKDVPIAKVIGAACSHPVMAPRRLVLVKGAEVYKAEDLEPLAAYCEKPLKTTCLVFVSSDKADLRRKFFKSLDAQGGLIECRPLWENEVGAWISRLAKEKGCKVEPAAHALFLDYVGTDLLAIGQTIEKASLLAGEGKAITEPIAEQVVALSRQAVIWDVFDAAAEGRAGESLVELQKLLAGGEKPAALLPGLWWVFRRLWQVSELSARRLSRDEISRELLQGGGRPPSFRQMDRLLTQSRRISPQKCRRLARRFSRLDRLSKGGSQFPEIHLERLLLEIAGAV